MNNYEKKYDSLLGQAHVANLLLLLLDKGEIIASQLRLVLKNYAKIASVAKMLEKEGLIKIRTESSPRISYIYSLTERGKAVAEKLREIEEILNE